MMARPDLDVTALPLNDESVRLIVHSLALECHEFALSCGILSRSVESQLKLVGRAFSDYGNDLLQVRHVPTTDASCVASIVIGFSNEGYRRVARAAKNRVAHSVDGDADA
jgi:hypothetical protein